MNQECHRCGADLDPGSGSFCCPHCGAPQLHIAPALSAAAAVEDGSPTTGTAPPPRVSPIRWKIALTYASVAAGIGAALFAVASFVPALTIFSLLWILSAGSMVTAHYRRRYPALPMNGSIGARIGLSVGLLMTFFLSIALAVIGLVARFGMHSMAAFDAEMSERLQEQVGKALAANPAPASIVQQMLSAEFRTGIMLAGLCFLGLFVLALSTVTGLLSGMMGAGRRRSA